MNVSLAPFEALGEVNAPPSKSAAHRALICAALSDAPSRIILSALTEVLNVIPVLFDRLSITSDMRLAAWALCLGKMLGALIAGLMEV